jgi:glycerol-3-phosphate dehydrogenase (NAD(P)+)
VGQGSDPRSIIAEQKTVVEGYSSVESLHEIAQCKGLDMPILKELYAILYTNKSPKLALSSLMMRDLKSEV